MFQLDEGVVASGLQDWTRNLERGDARLMATSAQQYEGPNRHDIQQA